MNRTKRHVLALALAIALLAIPTIVFAKELGSLTISGPGIKGEVTLDHPGGMRKLEGSGFFDQAKPIKPPEKLGEGYNITANLNLDGKLVPFVQMVYYPATEGAGYVHYTGRLNGESLQSVDQWGQLSPDAEAAFRGLMDFYNITLQPAVPVVAPAVVAPAIESAKSEEQTAIEPASVPAVTSAPSQARNVEAALIASILILLGAGLLFRRQAISQRRA